MDQRKQHHAAGSDPDSVPRAWEPHRVAANSVVAAAAAALGMPLPTSAERAFWGQAVDWLQAGKPDVCVAAVATDLARRPLRSAKLGEWAVHYFDGARPADEDRHEGERIQLVARLVAAALQRPDAPFELFSAKSLLMTFDDAVDGAEMGDSSSAVAKLVRHWAVSGGRRHLTAAPAAEAFSSLAAEMHNFSEVIEFYAGQAALLQLGGQAVARFPPVLLLGEAGIGKTLFAASLARLIGSPWRYVGLAGQTAGWVISGLDRAWSSGRPGLIVDALIASSVGNVVVLLDEIDKANTDSRYNVLGGLYGLLEADTAATFVDEYLGMPINASAIIWICTANGIENIPGPICSRLTVFEVPPPDRAQARHIVQRQFRRIRGAARFRPLADDVVDRLAGLTPRRIGTELRAAMGRAARRAALAGHQVAVVRVEDLGPLPRSARPIGFVAPDVAAPSRAPGSQR